MRYIAAFLIPALLVLAVYADHHEVGVTWLDTDPQAEDYYEVAWGPTFGNYIYRVEAVAPPVVIEPTLYVKQYITVRKIRGPLHSDYAEPVIYVHGCGEVSDD